MVKNTLVHSTADAPDSAETQFDPMTGEVMVPGGSQVATFQPQAFRADQGKLDAIIAFAKRIGDWTLVETAVAQKIEEQREFVRWWSERVRRKGERGNNPDLGYFVDEAESLTGISQQQVSRWKKNLSKPEKYHEQLCGPQYRKYLAEEADHNHRAQGSSENEWYTPPECLKAVYDVLGSIDLDPASSDAAQKIVRAKAYFTKEQDGLKQDWHVVLRHGLLHQIRVAQDGRNQVVEVVRHAAGQPADALEALRFNELPLRVLERRQRLPLARAHPGGLELALDDRRQPVQPCLHDEVVGARAHRLDGVLFAARAGHHDERQVGIEALDHRQRFIAAEAGHVVIGNHDVEPPFAQRGAQIVAGVDASHIGQESLAAELQLQQPGVVLGILDHQHVYRSNHVVPPSLKRAPRALGLHSCVARPVPRCATQD